MYTFDKGKSSHEEIQKRRAATHDSAAERFTILLQHENQYLLNRFK